MDTHIVQQSTLFGESHDVTFQPYKGYRYNLPKDKSYCKSCHQTKDASEFSRSKVSTNGVYFWCKECVKKKDEPYKDARTEKRLLRQYGISLADYQAMLDEQGGVCAICKQPESTTRNGVVDQLAVDHDHATGKVRGLLCAMCNHGLGAFRDRPDLLNSAKEYLRKSKEC